jgi:hypothetical protein
MEKSAVSDIEKKPDKKRQTYNRINSKLINENIP